MFCSIREAYCRRYSWNLSLRLCIFCSFNMLFYHLITWTISHKKQWNNFLDYGGSFRWQSTNAFVIFLWRNETNEKEEVQWWRWNESNWKYFRYVYVEQLGVLRRIFFLVMWLRLFYFIVVTWLVFTWIYCQLLTSTEEEEEIEMLLENYLQRWALQQTIVFHVACLCFVFSLSCAFLLSDVNHAMVKQRGFLILQEKWKIQLQWT